MTLGGAGQEKGARPVPQTQFGQNELLDITIQSLSCLLVNGRLARQTTYPLSYFFPSRFFLDCVDPWLAHLVADGTSSELSSNTSVRCVLFEIVGPSKPPHLVPILYTHLFVVLFSFVTVSRSSSPAHGILLSFDSQSKLTAIRAGFASSFRRVSFFFFDRRPACGHGVPEWKLTPRSSFSPSPSPTNPHPALDENKL